MPLSIGDPRRINHVSTHEKKQKETNNKIPSLKVLGVLSPFFQEGAKQGSGAAPRGLFPRVLQRDIQQHHEGKAGDDAHRGEIGVGILVAAAFGNQLVNGNQNHRTGSKSERKGENAAN